LTAGKAGRYAGGNPVCSRPTPEWQKGISTFMKKLEGTQVEADGENQPVVEVTDEVTATDNGARSLVHFIFLEVCITFGIYCSTFNILLFVD